MVVGFNESVFEGAEDRGHVSMLQSELDFS
jgi:hypothetical protein